MKKNSKWNDAKLTCTHLPVDVMQVPGSNLGSALEEAFDGPIMAQKPQKYTIHKKIFLKECHYTICPDSIIITQRCIVLFVILSSSLN
jgi:hypothetical protein